MATFAPVHRVAYTRERVTNLEAKFESGNDGVLARQSTVHSVALATAGDVHGGIFPVTGSTRVATAVALVVTAIVIVLVVAIVRHLEKFCETESEKGLTTRKDTARMNESALSFHIRLRCSTHPKSHMTEGGACQQTNDKRTPRRDLIL